MKDSPTKKRTKKAILQAISKLSENSDEFITIAKIAKATGFSHQNLRACYLPFIRGNCDNLKYLTGKNNSLDKTVSKSRNEKLKKLNPDLSEKAFGIGIVDHETYRR